MAKLSELLTENEKAKFLEQQKHFIVDIEIDIDVKKMTIEQLSRISFLLIATEYKNQQLPGTILCVEAINILIKRAQKLNINIF